MQGAILHRRVATCRSILLLLSGGRTQEVYGEDPTHAAEMVGRYVRGMQQRGRAPAGAAQPELLLAGSVTKHWMVRTQLRGCLRALRLLRHLILSSGACRFTTSRTVRATLSRPLFVRICMSG